MTDSKAKFAALLRSLEGWVDRFASENLEEADQRLLKKFSRKLSKSAAEIDKMRDSDFDLATEKLNRHWSALHAIVMLSKWRRSK